MDSHWYPTSLGERVKVDEFLDFWQSAMNPAVLRLVQMKLMFKVNRDKLKDLDNLLLLIYLLVIYRLNHSSKMYLYKEVLTAGKQV